MFNLNLIGAYSSASEVYAFTVLLNELLVEEVPFGSMSLPEIVKIVLCEKNRPGAYVSMIDDPIGCHLMLLINKGWQHEPLDRITFKQVVSKLNVLLQEAASKAKDGSSTGTMKLTDKEMADVVNCYFRCVQRDHSDTQFALGNIYVYI